MGEGLPRLVYQLCHTCPGRKKAGKSREKQEKLEQAETMREPAAENRDKQDQEARS